MFGINNCQFLGRLTKDVEVRSGNGERPYCYFRMAIDQGTKTDANGNIVNRDPLYLDFSANGNYANIMGHYGKKGRLVLATGALAITERVDDNGQKYQNVTIRLTTPPQIFSGYALSDEAKAAAPAESPAAGTPQAKQYVPQNNYNQQSQATTFSQETSQNANSYMEEAFPEGDASEENPLVDQLPF